MHVPAKDDGAKAKSFLRNGEKFVLGHDLATKHAIDIYAGHLDFGVIFEGPGQLSY